jgi:hypothetical protein
VTGLAPQCRINAELAMTHLTDNVKERGAKNLSFAHRTHPQESWSAWTQSFFCSDKGKETRLHQATINRRVSCFPFDKWETVGWKNRQ